MSFLRRNNVNVAGHGETPIVFVHGYGCDQTMWRFVLPTFSSSYKTVAYDLAGFGHSDITSYDRSRYSSLHGHASDLLGILNELELPPAIVVGHSVSATIAVLAANQEPERISAVVMVAPSPSYLNDEAYKGGFERPDVEGLLDLLESNQTGWSNKMAPVVIGSQDTPELTAELNNSFCRMDPDIARHFGRVTFMSDHRADAKRLQQPALVLQCSDDLLAPFHVGEWLKHNMEHCELAVIKTKGHCPHLTDPAETVRHVQSFFQRHASDRAIFK